MLPGILWERSERKRGGCWWRERSRGGQARAGRAEVERKPPVYSVLRLVRVVVRLWVTRDGWRGEFPTAIDGFYVLTSKDWHIIVHGMNYLPTLPVILYPLVNHNNKTATSHRQQHATMNDHSTDVTTEEIHQSTRKVVGYTQHQLTYRG
jgi:hypothetical protein